MSVLIKIREYQNLSASESVIQSYILKNAQDFLNQSVREVAKETYTSPSTVVRFCKRIEPLGFNTLKLKLATEVDSYKNINLDVLDSTIIEPNDSFNDVIEKITHISIQSIEETRLLLDESIMQHVAALIAEHSIIDFYGTGASNVVATDAAFKFMRIGKVSQCFQLYDRQTVQALNSNSHHVAMVFSFSGETKEMIDIAKKLQENGTQTVAIVGTIGSALPRYTDYTIYVSAKETTFRSGAMASRTAQLYVVDLLYAMCSLYDYEKSHLNVAKTRISL
ncbi:MurR/RpiR family transcriptional regulator [Erysipelothrix sp. HDW6C]|uniref:MurR/RpiR family transcriptional regulator n=1 Tax=Erysipelothrix sp. HDW6C TaxID=2714930 RepID=UPI00140CED5E|nr:MurR/RpiR family transcriptional regulator [Erysipelothrix sp. HDW6C]QIK69839.1 MurR/RpiR family transcriptional regulator [Erysipelothrix sp. HDW6C]